MLDYLEKFNNLPDEIKERISAPNVIKKLEEIESKFDIDLATLVIRVVVGDIQLDKLADYLIENYELNQLVAEGLDEEMKANIFSHIPGQSGASAKKPDVSQVWLDERRKSTKSDSPSFFFSPQDEEEIKGIKKDHPAGSDIKSAHDGVEQQIDTIVASVNLNFTSQELLERFRNILKIYLIGVRSKIDTRQTLLKKIENGGLGLEVGMVDKIITKADFFIARKNSAEIAKPNQFKIAEDKIMTRQDVYSGESEEAPATPVDTDQIKSGDVPYDFSKLVKGARPEKRAKTVKESAAVKKDKSQAFVSDTASIKEASKEENSPDFSKVKEGEAKSGLQQDHKKLKIEEVLENIDKNKETKEASSSQPPKSTFPPALDLREVSRIQTAEKELEKTGPEAREEEIIEHGKVKEDEAVTANKDDLELVFSRAVVKDIEKLNNLKRQEIKRPARRRANGKVNMDDIVYEPKLIGPVEELGTMSLVNFRRLSEDPKEAIEKILEKLDTLEEDNYKKRLEGIAAWRRSPVNQLYLAIGQESIDAGGIKEAIKNRQSSGEESLSQGEFEAIMDLNKKIRFK